MTTSITVTNQVTSITTNEETTEIGSSTELVTQIGAPEGPQGIPAVYSDADPEPLGVADPGNIDAAARVNHVHEMPSAEDVGALPLGPHAAYSVIVNNTGASGDLVALEPTGALQALGTDSSGALGFYRPALFESTGALSGFALSINADTTKFNIAAGYAGFTDYSSNPVQPVRTVLAYAGATGLTATFLTSDLTSYIGIGSDSTVYQQTTPFTNTQRRTIVVIGLLVHSNLTIINAINTIVGPVRAGINQLHDYLEYRGPLSRGLIYSANGANLNLNRSSGSIFKFGANFQTSPLDPHVVTLSSAIASSFRYRTQLGEVSSDVTSIDPNNWDNAGTLTAMTGSRWSVQRITIFQSGLTRIQYGQATYLNLDEALANFQAEPFAVETNIAQNGVFRGWLLIRRSTTDLSDTARARFIAASVTGVPLSPGVTLASSDDLAEGSTHLFLTPAQDAEIAASTAHVADLANPHATTAAQVGAVPTSRTVTATSPLTGGGALSGDISIAIQAASASQAGSMSSTYAGYLDTLIATALPSFQLVTTATATIQAGKAFVYVTYNGGPVTLTVPAYIAGTIGVDFEIVKGGSGVHAITLVTTGIVPAEFIFGLTTFTIPGSTIDPSVGYPGSFFGLPSWRFKRTASNAWVPSGQVPRDWTQGVPSMRSLQTTAPSDIGTAASGSSVQGSPGDHVHAIPASHITLAMLASALQSAAQGTESTRKIYTSAAADIGVAASGSSVQAAAGDHVHAIPSSYVTLAMIAAAVKSAAQGTESLRQIYTSTPAAIGTAAAGSSVQAAAGDHVHAISNATVTLAMLATAVQTVINQAALGAPASTVQTIASGTTGTVAATDTCVLIATGSGNFVLTMRAYNDGDEILIIKTSTDANTVSLARPGGAGTIQAVSATFLLPGSAGTVGYIAWLYRVVGASAAVVA